MYSVDFQRQTCIVQLKYYNLVALHCPSCHFLQSKRVWLKHVVLRDAAGFKTSACSQCNWWKLYCLLSKKNRFNFWNLNLNLRSCFLYNYTHLLEWHMVKIYRALWYKRNEGKRCRNSRLLCWLHLYGGFISLQFVSFIKTPHTPNVTSTAKLFFPYPSFCWLNDR